MAGFEDRTDTAELLAQVLGYFNFSSGSPDSGFQRNLNRLASQLQGPDKSAELCRKLVAGLGELQGTSAFRDTHQAGAVIDLVFSHVLPAYDSHHRDLLHHLTGKDRFQPFFVARVVETVLSQGGPWEDVPRIVRGSLQQLNDFLGHRPVAVLETEREIQPYDHEAVRPIPLYIPGAGVSMGKYQDVITHAIEILEQSPPDVLQAASFNFGQMEELAVDPRSYDFSHPVHQRPNYVFGEWDPHRIDGRGRYARFVLRMVTLDALVDRIENSVTLAREQAIVEASAVLSGTMLMASGVSGAGPATHDSDVTLDTLIPAIARYRDAFYEHLLARIPGSHGDRLRQEASSLRQPFGGARQHLNQYLARVRADQMQNAAIAHLFAGMGHADAARSQVAVIPAASARMICELRCYIAKAHAMTDQERFSDAAESVSAVEDILRRGIQCGAVVDPWNILGFQGQFSIFVARENSVSDHRVEQLTELMHEICALHARLIGAAAARGDTDLVKRQSIGMDQLATWWDRFATIDVGGVQQIHGRVEFESATNVANALTAWREQDNALEDVGFWRDRSELFNSPRSYGLVVSALLERRDRRASMGLLMHWLGRAREVPLEGDSHSFHELAQQWSTLR